MKPSATRTPSLAIAAAALLLLGACSTPPTKLRADESLQSANPVKNIAIVGAARVIRPRVGNNEPALSLADSKKAVEVGLPALAKALEQRGYRVVRAEPVGVGYAWPAFKENWVYTFESKAGQDSEGDKYQITDGSPAFEYATTAALPEYRAAVRREFEQMYRQDINRTLRSYTPQVVNLEAIRKVVPEADTVCFVNVWGRQFSGARKAGDFALGVVAAMFGAVRVSNVQDGLSTHIACSQVATGKVLWQHWQYDARDPVEPDDDHYQKLLALFPKAAAQLTAGCKLVDKAASIYDCDLQVAQP